MPQTELARTAEIFSSRLKTLLYLLDKAEAQWREKGDDPAEAACRTARPGHVPAALPDRLRLQSGERPRGLARRRARESGRSPTPLSLAELRAHVEAAIRRQAESVAGADDGLLDREKHIDLSGGNSVVLAGPGVCRRLAAAELLFPSRHRLRHSAASGGDHRQGRLHGASGRARCAAPHRREEGHGPRGRRERPAANRGRAAHAAGARGGAARDKAVGRADAGGRALPAGLRQDPPAARLLPAARSKRC